jgi:hypothetical protein
MREFLFRNPQKYILASTLILLFLSLYETLILGKNIFPGYFFENFAFFFRGATPEIISAQLSPGVPFLFLFNAFVGWGLIHRIFQSHILGFLAATLSLMSPMLFSLGTTDHALFFSFAFFWTITALLFSFFSPTPKFFPMVLLAGIIGFLLLIFPASYAGMLFVTGLMMSFSLSVLTYKHTSRYYYFLFSTGLSAGILWIFFQTSQSTFYLENISGSKPLILSQYFSLIKFYTQNFDIFFPGFLLLITALLGMIFYWHRFVLLAFFLIFCVFFGFGAWQFFWESWDFSSHLFLLPISTGVIFFTLLFVWFSPFKHKIFYQALELLFVFILITESFHLSMQHHFFQQLIFSPTTQEKTEKSDLIADTTEFLEKFGYRSILDDKNLVPGFLWQKEGRANTPLQNLENENLLALGGTGVIFS